MWRLLVVLILLLEGGLLVVYELLVVVLSLFIICLISLGCYLGVLRLCVWFCVCLMMGYFDLVFSDLCVVICYGCLLLIVLGICW